jgi:hypothetical protein
MSMPLVVLIPWVLSLLAEFWLITILVRKKLYRELPVFAAVVMIYAVLDLAVFTSVNMQFYTYMMYAIREISSAVLRTWLLITLCRQLLQRHVWTKWLMMLALVVSATVLIGISFPTFLDEHTAGTALSYMQVGVWLRTAYFTQVGVIAVLFLMNFNSIVSTFTRDMGIAMGLATTSAAELVSMTLRGRPGGRGDPSLVSLNYVGMLTATAIWIMFLTPRRKDIFEGSVARERSERALSASGE